MAKRKSYKDPQKRYKKSKWSSGARAGYTRRGNGPWVKRSGKVRSGGYYGRYTGLNAEKKFFDTTLSFTFDTTGEVPATGQLCLIPQGVTESTRVGRKCTVRSLQLRGKMTYVPGAETNGANQAYLLVVLDKQCNGAAAAITDVMTSNDLASGMINLANSERFRVLRRMTYKFQAGAGIQAAFGRDVNMCDEFFKLNLPLEYSSTTGAITELKSNNIFLIAGSDGGADDLVFFTGTARLRYSDV